MSKTRGNSVIMIFAPHPDDETFGCGGTVMKRIQEGYDVVIVVMTDGRNAFRDVLGIAEDPAPEVVRQMRMEEIFRATQILGVPRERLHMFDFEDGELNKEQKDAEKKTLKILEKYCPTEVYFTYEKDCNIDHRTTNQIVRSCMKKVCPSAACYQYSISQKHYPFNWLMSILRSLLQRNLVFVDVSAFLSRKEDAIKQYVSQITRITDRQKRPVMQPYHIKQFLKGKEAFFAKH